LADYQWESEWQPYFHNEAVGLSNLDDLLMQFKGTIDSMQQAFKRAETQIGKLVDDMINVVVRREKEYAEIETHQEIILQVNTIHHQLIIKEERDEVSIIPKYPCIATTGYVVGKDNGQLELSVEDQKISFDLFEAMKHPDMSDACCDILEISTRNFCKRCILNGYIYMSIIQCMYICIYIFLVEVGILGERYTG